MLILRLLAYLLWIPALFAVIAAVILPVVGSGLSRRSRVAASWPQIGCARYAVRHSIPVILEYENDAYRSVEGEPSAGVVARYHHRAYGRV